MVEPPFTLSLEGKTVLITGAARRLGKVFALAVARAGGNVVIHHGHSQTEALETAQEIRQLGRKAEVVEADLSDVKSTQTLIQRASAKGPLYALVNSAAIFEPLSFNDTNINAWERHLAINLTSPFLLSQAFSTVIPPEQNGRIINILDWRAMRPQADHFPYTVSKASLAALTKSMAVALAPRITVNGLALGAVLPPSTGKTHPNLIEKVPADRWAALKEVEQSLLFLLAGPSYITGEILYLDGGRHLV